MENVKKLENELFNIFNKNNINNFNNYINININIKIKINNIIINIYKANGDEDVLAQIKDLNENIKNYIQFNNIGYKGL